MNLPLVWKFLCRVTTVKTLTGSSVSFTLTYFALSMRIISKKYSEACFMIPFHSNCYSVFRKRTKHWPCKGLRILVRRKFTIENFMNCLSLKHFVRITFGTTVFVSVPVMPFDIWNIIWQSRIAWRQWNSIFSFIFWILREEYRHRNV